MKAVPDSVLSLEHHSKKYGYYEHNGILKIAIHTELIMQMQVHVGYLKCFIYSDGGLRKFY